LSIVYVFFIFFIFSTYRLYGALIRSGVCLLIRIFVEDEKGMAPLRLSRRAVGKTSAVVAVIVIVLVAAVAGYMLYKPPVTPVETTTTEAPGPTTLVVDKANELQSVDPSFDYEYAGWEVIANLYETLITYDKTDPSKFMGVLATEWSSSPDGLVYTFKLRQDVKFSNGDLFDANAVKYSFDRVVKMNQPPSWILSQSLNLDSVKVLDPYTVEIHLTRPYTAFLATMATMVASIVDPMVVEAHGGVVANATNTWMDSNVVSTAPFILQEWIKGDHLTLARNPNYWGTPPKLEKVILYYKTSVQTRLVDLKSGFAQIAIIDINHVSDVQGVEGIQIQSLGVAAHIDFIYFNTKIFPFNNTLARQAVVHAINYDAITSGINKNLTVRYTGPFCDGLEGYDKNLAPYTYDPALAKQLLAQAGYPDGKGFPTISYLYYSRDASVALIAQEVQQDLANIGINVNLLGVSFSTYIDKILAGPKGVPEMGWTEWYADYLSPDDFVVPFANPDFPPVGWNPAYYSDSKITQLYQDAPYNPDAAARLQMYHSITQIMYDAAPYAWLGQFTSYQVFRSNVHGIYNNVILGPGNSLDYSTIYLTAA
jgi:peptide/nickel transport system substrate-binding protein